MQNLILYIISLFVFIILCQHLTLSDRRCRCLSKNSTCWPNASVRQTFNQSINGQLIFTHPSAAECNSNSSNVNACTIAAAQWSNSSWRSDQAGAMQNHNWENSSCSISLNSSTCNQGSVPILAVNATLPEHIQLTLQLVKTYNLRLVIKATGHDYLGRSTAAGSLLLWLHYMKNMTLIKNFSLCSGEIISNVIRVGAGIQWGEVYNWLYQYNLTAIGAQSTSVSAIGGYLQGGGHGSLTRWKGLAVDQVLEFDVIMADGRRQKVNSCENSDLFWALRGGGAGTFAIALSAVLRTYPSPSVIVSFQSANAPNATRFASFVHHFVQLLPTLADVGWSDYFHFSLKTFVILFTLTNGNLSTANTTMNQLRNGYTDFNFTEPAVFPLPSYRDFVSKILESSFPSGGNVIFGSRLIPESVVRNQQHQLVDAILQANGGNQSTLMGHLVADGQVSNTTQNTSVNPIWRTALINMIYAQTWSDGISLEEQQRLAKHVTKQVEILDEVAGGSQSGAYLNEADPNEPNWQQKFFGTIENYNRLKSIKDTVDPNGLFKCKKCVGCDDWLEDLNCPKIKYN